jgi:hypothetical protein
MKGISPIKLLAVKEFNEKYLSLFSVSAELSSFEKTLIEHNAELMWLDNFCAEDKKNINQTAIVCNHFLVNGSVKKRQLVTESVLNIANSIIPAFNKCVAVRGMIRELDKNDYDTRIELNLRFYKTIYEALLPIIISPIVYGFSIHNEISDKDFTPRDDGKIRLRVLKKMEKWLISPQNRLSIGLNNHIRNAYAHETYRILDNGKVELLDRDPNNPKNIWGPEIWEYSKLEELCHLLWVNIFGILDGLLIFLINNRKLARNSKWAQPKPLNIKLRRDEFIPTVRKLCNDLSFNFINGNNNTDCNMDLSTLPKGIDQDEGIILKFSDGSSKSFKVPVKYEERLIAKQLFTLLDFIRPFFKKENNFIVTVNSYKRHKIGVLEGNFNSIDEFINGEIILTEIYSQNTLCENNMFVRVQNPIH